VRGDGPPHLLLCRCLSDNRCHTGWHSCSMAICGADRVAGTELRHAICVCLLRAQSPLTVPEVVAGVEALGCSVPGRPSKSISDAVRWEVRKGRVVRLGRSLYQIGSMPRSTEWWMRRKIASLPPDCRSDTG
jgi:hypothetical protein